MSLKTAVLCACLVTGAAVPLCAQGDTVRAIDPSNRALMALIDRAIASPLSDVPLWVRIRDSSNARHDSTVYSPAVTPWMFCGHTREEMTRRHTILLLAFVAGNLREQLVTGKMKNQPMAGVRTVLQVYAKLRADDPSFAVPEIDAWLRLQPDTLDRRIADAAVSHPRDCPPRN